ncbi:retinol dehydrogenase 1 isoform X2 [Amphiprion ocellaris]|uniref:retinol dehydrogenase 1 isoform X2 n=1 Tax=Amphiprion ocellaris TaxID=80972 RepID=UPI002410FDC5|nr:retinol dehydrogenase 1 isoform X2 [Amphiprion ocellaris]XP_054871407.1 retinol dehydrogenase 1 isoform X2 [Amphiprion ocellaris]
MVSTDCLAGPLLEILLCHPALTCVFLLAFLAAVRWYIRDSYKVEGFSQKHVFITGCDSGFGNLLARQLDRKGFHVIAACLTEKGAADLGAAASPRLKTLLLDVTDGSSIRKAVEFVSREVSERGLWGLVNNAGRSIPIGPTEWMQLEDFKKVLDVNLIGVVDVTLHFLPLLKKARGRVVNVASILGRLSLTGGGYCLSKWGVEAFSDSLRLQEEPYEDEPVHLMVASRCGSKPTLTTWTSTGPHGGLQTRPTSSPTPRLMGLRMPPSLGPAGLLSVGV